jgi:hypothetical protein
VIVLLGNLVLSVVGRLGYRAQGIEALALAWVFGSGLASLGMLWLNALGLSLTAQVGALTLVAVIGCTVNLKRWVHNGKRWAVHLQLSRLKPRPLMILLLGCFVLQLAFIFILVVGQPSMGWDSWSSWGMRARTIFLEGSITRAVYADPSRASTLPYYPLFTPLLQAGRHLAFVLLSTGRSVLLCRSTARRRSHSRASSDGSSNVDADCSAVSWLRVCRFAADGPSHQCRSVYDRLA